VDTGPSCVCGNIHSWMSPRRGVEAASHKGESLHRLVNGLERDPSGVDHLDTVQLDTLQMVTLQLDTKLWGGSR